MADDEADMGLGVWAGVLPQRLTAGAPEADESGVAGLAVPEYVVGYER